MNRKEKLEMLRKLSEKELTQNFLIPLYESEGMECKNVRYTHRKLEFGKDIIYYKDDEHGNRIYTGVQVKRTKIATRDVDTISRQIFEAFGETFTDMSDGKKKDLDRFVVLTSNKFLEEAKDSLWALLRGAKLDKLVTAVDGNQLVALLKKHLPSALWEEYDYFSKYFNAMKADFETIKDISAIGQREPVPLENIYVSLRLSEKIKRSEVLCDSIEFTIKLKERESPIEKERTIVDEKTEPRKEERHAERERILDAERAVKEFDKLVIVGALGSGKTTLLKHLALKSCKENLEKQERTCVPIPITLREFSESGKDLKQYIDEVFEKYQFPKAKEFVEIDLKKGKCQLLLDGFDELATKERQEKITAEIQEFIEKYPKCQFIVTSRIAGYHDELRGFTKLELMEFDDKQIEKFIENWFGETNPKKAKSMLAAIKENEQIKTLARNPLMIAIIAIIYEEDRALPQKRAKLYERCAEVLLSKWDVQRGLKNKYPSEKKEFILRKLAFYGHSNNKRLMTEKEVMKELIRYFPQVQLKREDAKPFLDEIWQRSYLLRQISIDRYNFLHLSFQEYFTALELKEQEEGISTIIKHLLEPWWEEPILLYAGISKDAAALIKRIKKEVPEDIFYSNLLLFGKCVADADFTEPRLREEIINELWSLYQTAEFSSLKEKAIEVLALIKPDKVIDSLIKELDAKDSDVRCSAAEALGKIGSEKAIEPLIGALSTAKDSIVRLNAAEALEKIGSEKAVKPLIKAFITEEDISVRLRAVLAFGTIGSEKAIEPLIDALLTAKDNILVRWGAAFALGQIGSEKAIESLINTISTAKDSIVRWSAAFALGQIRSEKAIELLIDALSTAKVGFVRWNAAEALGKIGSEKAIEPLIDALATAKDSEVRLRAAKALGNIGDTRAVEPLKSALKDEGEWIGEKVKDKAFASLENISRRIKMRVTLKQI
jgi:HEAT repeat protein/energy-coupling factor transporter ATP-binding protein EcfA2